MKKIIYSILIIFFCLSNVIYATDTIMENMLSEVPLNDLRKSLEENSAVKLDLFKLATDLIKGQGINIDQYRQVILNIVEETVGVSIKGLIGVLIVVVICSIATNLSTENSSDIANICQLVCFLVIAITCIAQYLVIIKSFEGTINGLTQVLSIISPILMGLLIATGAVITSSLTSPLILLLSTIVSNVTSYVILPMLSLSIVFNVISGIGNIKLQRLSKCLNKWSIGIISVILTIILAFMELQNTVTLSTETIGLKTTQAIVGNVVPVVGGFVSDSLEIVCGATATIGKVVGAIGIFVVIACAIKPILSIGIYVIALQILSAILESMGANEKNVKLIDSFAQASRTILGLMTAIVVIYIVALGLVIGLMGKVVT